MVNTKTNQSDIIIIGGGMVGAALACALARHHEKTITVLESGPLAGDWQTGSFDLRVSAINRASQDLLSRIHVWHTIEQLGAHAYYDMHVWDGTGDGEIHFDAAEVGTDCLGHIIENRVIQKALQDRLLQFPNIRLIHPATAKNLRLEQQQAQLELEDGTHLSADLLVGADGANSWVRQQSGIDLKTLDYRQKAVVANVNTELPHQDTAWQRFMPSGPLAFLPMRDNVSSIVWSTSHQHADELLAMDDESFCRALAAGLDYRLGDILSTSERAAFPLISRHAEHYVKPRLALIGDAAHTIHPLAGQGVNLGFADVVALSEIVLKAWNAKRDIGQPYTLRRYERQRKGENLLVQTSMSGFKYLFGNELPLLTPLRNLGINLTHRATPLKNQLIRFAMGQRS